MEAREARRIIDNLGQSGQPPKRNAHAINVGTGKMLDRLTRDYLDDICLRYEGSDGGGTCKWIVANYGNGKTQFLRCMQELAWTRNYVTAFVELSQKECPLDRSDRVYAAVARSIQAAPRPPYESDAYKGIDYVLEQQLDRKFPEVLSGTPGQPLVDAALVFVRGLGNLPVESTAFRTAAVAFLSSRVTGDESAANLTRLYLRGETAPADQLKKLGIYEKLGPNNGFLLLRSMCQFLQRSELAAGTLLLFDEARRSLSLMSTKAQKVACENLLSIINDCNSGNLPGTMFLYAVMPEFFTHFADRYAALQQRCGPATRFDLESLKGIKEQDLLREMGEKIHAIFRIAYEDDAPGVSASTKSNLAKLAMAALRKGMGGSGDRRIFVQSWVRALQFSLGEAEMSELDDAQVDAFISATNLELAEAERAEVNSDGE